MKKTTHFQLLLLCIFAMVCMPVFLSGQILKTWNGSSSNNWNTPTNWTPAGVPGEDDSVDIPADGVQIWPTISTNDAKAYDISIKPGASLEVFNTGTLTINGAFSLNSVVGVTLGNEGTIINRGVIYITKPYANGIRFADYGIYNFGPSSSFFNYPSGKLYIDNETDGIVNHGTFTNEGLITIGGGANVQPNAIVNSGTFNNNNCPALIDIVSSGATISNTSTFDNSGTILSNSFNGGSIGDNTGVVQGSISVQSGNAPLPFGLFGELWIGCNSTNWNDPKNWVRRLVPTSTTDVIVLDATYDPVITSIATAKSVTVFFDALLTVQFNGSLDISGNAPQPGLGLSEASLINLGTVENNGRITISDDGFTGITNFSLINNNTCATLDCPIRIYSSGSTSTINNAGLVKAANPMNLRNGATFINDGILENFQGNLLPDALTNNKLVVAPIYGCESTGIQPAIESVGTDFTVSTTWYSNPDLTGPAAGTYNQTTNTFTPSIGAGTHTLYMTIDGTPNCAKTVAILVNLTALDDASFSYALPNYCTDVANPMPTVTGLAGGLFSSSPAGLSIDPGSGLIDLSQSAPNTYTVTYTTTGTCPNSSNRTITVENCCAPPLASCKTTPINAILVGNSTAITTNDVDNGSTADCGLQLLEIDVNTFDCSHVGTPQTVTLTITDVNNDSHSCEATVNIIDDEVPTFTCPADLVINTNPGVCEGTVPNLLSGITDESDNCGIPTLSQNAVVNTLFGGADGDQMVVTITANDGNGNQNATSCEVTLTLNDNENPVPTCLDPIVELDDSGQYTLTEADVFDGGFDNCGTVDFVSISSTIVSCDDVNAPVSVIVTANDGNGNTGTCIATVTVVGTADDDCDGVFNECDICPGGDDSVDEGGDPVTGGPDGIPDCSQLLDYEEYSADWKCRKNKLFITHLDEDGNYKTLCVNKNSLPERLSIGDWAGPYQSCSQNLIAPGGDVAIASGHAVSNELTLFPNPASHQINILFNRQAPKATLRITDVLGKLMFTKELEEGVDRVVFDLDNGHFKNGIYLVSLSENGRTITKQMVVVQ